MRQRSLVLAGLRHHWRTHVGLFLGCAVATAVLVGALVVGDSVRHSLGLVAEARIGRVDAQLSSHDRFFREDLARELAEDGLRLAPVVHLPGVAASTDGGQRVHDVQVHGVDERFFALAPAARVRAEPQPGEGLMNATLAEQLGLQLGDEFVLRLEKPSAIPRDMALAPEDVSFALRIELVGVLADEDFGRFSLLGGHAAPANLFLSLHDLQRELEIPGRVNMLLADLPDDEDLGAAMQRLGTRLKEHWSLDDAELSLRPVAGSDSQLELITSRIFFDQPIVEVLERLDVPSMGAVFTYFVNGIEGSGRAIPYSMISALGKLGDAAPGAELTALMPADAQRGILLNRWAAEDLQLEAGASVELSYFVVDPAGRLVEASRSFLLEGIVPIEGLAADASLMPAFPGLSEADNCRDWDPGTPVDLERIRDQDEVYWDDYRGTPKGFVSLESGREMWTSRFGQLTAVRFAKQGEAALRSGLQAGLNPGLLGLYFRDLRTPALASASSPTDFGGLFIGLSFFLIFAALLLASQLFLFGVEARARELGLLAALGFKSSEIRSLQGKEAMLLALGGALLGALSGLGYTKAVLYGLEHLWSDAVAGFALSFDAQPATIAMGVLLALAAVGLTLWRSLGKKLAQSALTLLGQQAGSMDERALAPGVLGRRLGPLALAAALLIVLFVDADSGIQAAGAFFGAGALVLVAGLSFTRLVLRGAATRTLGGMGSICALGLSNAVRRPGRSQSTIALMAVGSFLVISVGAFHKGATEAEGLRSSGTGGFRFYGRTSLALVHDLNTPAGREFFALDEELMAGVSVVPFKLREGDEASCLNLSRPSQPRLLGVHAEDLAVRGAFPFAASLAQGEENPWLLLTQPLADGAIPAIGDTVSLTWQLKKGLGDTIAYQDERGKEYMVRIVGTIADTVLQGDLIIDAAPFSALYPSAGGYRRFLIDVQEEEQLAAVAQGLHRALEDVGLSLERTGARMDAFHAVQNGYLRIFQMLGALGLLLGSIGLGMVVLRNTLERRGELALVAALGFRPWELRWLLFSEYGALLLSGLVLGALSAALAILPALSVPGTELSLTNVGLQLALVAANGLLWILLAVQSAGTRAPLSALSEE